MDCFINKSKVFLALPTYLRGKIITLMQVLRFIFLVQNLVNAVDLCKKEYVKLTMSKLTLKGMEEIKNYLQVKHEIV